MVSCYIVKLESYVACFAHRWGRTLDSGGRTSIDDGRLESSGEEEESSKVFTHYFMSDVYLFSLASSILPFVL